MSREIFYDNRRVNRPREYWTEYVHHYLKFLVQQKMTNIPVPLELEENHEILSFVPGESMHYPLSNVFYTDELVISAGRQLRVLHDVSVGFIDQLQGDERWMLPITHEVEVMVHGDYAPYNVTVQNGVIFGIIDFDTIHPGSRIEDIAYAVYRFAPLTLSDDSLLEHKLRRAQLFLDAYDFKKEAREGILTAMIERLEHLIQYIIRQSQMGKGNFLENIEDGHVEIYRKDQEYLREIREAWLNSRGSFLLGMKDCNMLN